MNIFERLKNGIATASSGQTQAIAEELAQRLPEEAVITLEGDLGAGKTTFVKGLGKAWRIRETITSPTFNIFQVYDGQRRLLHMDAYRLDPSRDAVEELLLEDFATPPFCLVIEWPGNLGPIPWPVTIGLKLRIQEGGTHFIQSDSQRTTSQPPA